jgi:hypothetical protein
MGSSSRGRLTGCGRVFLQNCSCSVSDKATNVLVDQGNETCTIEFGKSFVVVGGSRVTNFIAAIKLSSLYYSNCLLTVVSIA